MQKLFFFFLFILVAQSSVSAQCLSQPTCPASLPTVCDSSLNNVYFWNDSVFRDPATNSYNLGETLTDLSMQIVDSCSTNDVQISFVLSLDLNGDGLRETIVSSIALPGAGLVYYGNVSNPNYTGGEARVFDARPVPTGQKYGFVLERLEAGSLITVRIRWANALLPNNYVLPELPSGRHRIEWHFERNGEARACAYEFVVKDCRPPTVTCANGLSINSLPEGFIQLYALDFVSQGEDNHTPATQLQYGIRRSGAGNGFPASNSVTFTCQDLGIQPVEIWARDLAGNASYCETYVIVQDNSGACGGGGGNLQIQVCAVGHCNGERIPYVDFDITGSHPAIPPISFFDLTDSLGCLNSLNNTIPLASNLTITPMKNDNPLNGVTTYDLILIARHILGLEPLGSPYKMIAADANKSGGITTFDLVELRKLILGILPALPNNNSWRFVDSSFVFPNATNPFQTVFPEVTTVANAQFNLNRLFYGIKIGDVNCSALQVLTQIPQEESLTIPNLYLQVGDIVEVPVHFLQSNGYYGFQFSLRFNPAQMEVLEVLSPVGTLGSGFAAFADHINVSSVSDSPFSVSPSEPILRFRIKARTTLHLADAFSLATSGLVSEAYPALDSFVRLRLQFGTVATTEPNAAQIIFNPVPNPTTAGTRIGLQLEQSEQVTVEVLDATGRLVYQQQQLKAAGAQWIELPATAFPQAGMYLWRVRAGVAFRAGKIVKQ